MDSLILDQENVLCLKYHLLSNVDGFFFFSKFEHFMFICTIDILTQGVDQCLCHIHMGSRQKLKLSVENIAIFKHPPFPYKKLVVKNQSHFISIPCKFFVFSFKVQGHFLY